MSEHLPYTPEATAVPVLERHSESRISLGRVFGWWIDHSPALAPLAEIARMRSEEDQPEEAPAPEQ